MIRVCRTVLVGVAVLLLCGACQSKNHRNQNSADLKERVHEIVLDNGMTFLLVAREGAPTFSVQFKVKVGSIEEELGHSGLAHFFEHMAFKGTDKIGTKDFAKEKPILDQVLSVGTQIAEMKQAGKAPQDYADLLNKRHELEAQEKELIEKNEFVSIYQRSGGSNINASTSNDFTTYYVSLPVSKFELWAYLESERLQNRVFREFFTEDDVVAEERRMRIDNSPDGKLYEAYLDAGFTKSPYKRHPIGYAKDIAVYTPEAAKAFYSKYYVPSRMVVALVGNLDVDKAEKVIRKYFAKIPKGENVEKDIPQESFDKGTFPRHVTVYDPGNPRFFLGYHRPTHPHPDDIVLDVVQQLLCSGRTSRLYKRLVLTDRSVSQVGCVQAVPGVRLDTLFTFVANPLDGHTNQEIEAVMKEEFQKLATQGPSEQELQIIKNKIDAGMVYSMESNMGLAEKLAFYKSLTGDWKYIYEMQDRVHKVTPQDVQRVIKSYFVPEREVAAYLEQKK